MLTETLVFILAAVAVVPWALATAVGRCRRATPASRTGATCTCGEWSWSPRHDPNCAGRRASQIDKLAASAARDAKVAIDASLPGPLDGMPSYPARMVQHYCKSYLSGSLTVWEFLDSVDAVPAVEPERYRKAREAREAEREEFARERGATNPFRRPNPTKTPLTDAARRRELDKLAKTL